jgi:hypothetical protein
MSVQPDNDPVTMAAMIQSVGSLSIPNRGGASRRIAMATALLACLLLPLHAQDARPAGRPDFAAFQIIVERNIFNPRRGPPGSQSDRRDDRAPAKVESFTLVGTLTYEKGPYAFFDGTSADFHKALQLDGAIAGYKITNIVGNQVQLVSGTNAVALRVGMQMRREDEGAWEPIGTYIGASTASVSSSGSSVSSSAEEDSDALKRLMQQREQELK